MNIRYLRTTAVVLAFLFVTGCYVLVRDEDGYRRRYHRRGWPHHSLLQQSPQSPVQMTAQSNGGQEAIDR